VKKIFRGNLLALIFFIGCTAPISNHSGQHDQEESRITVEIPSEQQQRIGLGVTTVEKRPIRHTIRTVGIVKADQTREAHIHMRVSGWVEEILVDYIGKTVRKGDTLFRLYSPELVTTQDELLAALRIQGSSSAIAKTVRERLRFFGMSETEINEVAKERAVHRQVTFLSPLDGYIVNKVAIKGMYVTPNTELYYIADISKVWIQATLYESDIALTNPGNKAKITSTYDTTVTLLGEIDFISPEIDPVTRTAQARIRIDNDDFKFKPGMFANVEIKHDLGEQTVIPADSVIDTGMRQIVFVKSGVTRFDPREVKLGTRVDEGFIVLSGLKAGERVVSSANFLIDAESKIQAILQRGEGTKGPSHGQH
jgi:Cu(I)/Ag(I) efflux system membrane fusion protein